MKCTDAFFAKSWAPFVLIGLTTALVWGHTLAFQFVWDDRQFIQELESIRSLRNVPAMFSSLDAQSSYPEGFKLFRPLRTVHYALLYQLSGEHAPLPWLYHAANLAWHAGTAMMLYAVALQLFSLMISRSGSRTGVSPAPPAQDSTLPSAARNALAGRLPCIRAQWLALFIALAFSVHPVVSEVVCWAKSLDDAMAAVFTLASLHALLNWNGERRRYGVALLWFVLAVYSKISAIPFALVAFLLFYQIRHVSFVRSAKLASGFFLVALLFMVHRHLVIGQSAQTAPLSGSYGQTLIDTVPVGPEYLRLLCGIPPFCIDYSFMPGHLALSSTPVRTGMALMLVAVAVVGFTFRRGAHSLLAFGLLWIGAFLLPVSNLLPMMQYMAERFLYLPLIGWLFILGYLVHRVPRWQWSAPIGTAVLVAWSALAWNRSLLWRDEVTLFVRSSQLHPGIRRVEDNAVAAIFQLPHMRAMFAIEKPSGNLRVIATPPPAQQDAIRATLEEAHRLFPKDETVACSLGILHATAGQPAAAMPFFKLTVQQQPGNARFWNNLGQAALDAQAWSDAEEAIARAVSLAPENIDVLRTASRFAWKQKDYQAATNYFQRLQRLDPNQPDHTRWLLEAEAKLTAQSQSADGVRPVR